MGAWKTDEKEEWAVTLVLCTRHGYPGGKMMQAWNALRENTDLWDLYTRKEEYSPKQLDQYGCFPFTGHRYADILTPAVSEFLIDNGFSIDYPGNRQFAVCLTHDVDEIYPPFSHTVYSSLTCLKERDFSGLSRQVCWKVQGKKKSPYRNFKEIITMEERYGACSSFYFLATDDDIYRFRYAIEDLADELGQIIDAGGEVGLHGGYYAYDTRETIRREKRRLEQVLGRNVIGYRNHYLRFKVPDTWEILKKEGFIYDTTLGYNEMIGFRNGMCHPFRPYNLNTDKEIDILEIPLALMDSALFDMVHSYRDAWDLVQRLIDTVASCRGVLTLNWHSNNFFCPFRARFPEMYEQILQYCTTKNAWMTNSSTIVDWWKKNT